MIRSVGINGLTGENDEYTRRIVNRGRYHRGEDIVAGFRHDFGIKCQVIVGRQIVEGICVSLECHSNPIAALCAAGLNGLDSLWLGQSDGNVNRIGRYRGSACQNNPVIDVEGYICEV